MLFSAMMHVIEGLNLETLLTLKAEQSLFFLVDTRRPAVPITATVDFNLGNRTINGASR
jgi:hypothetical protein